MICIQGCYRATLCGTSGGNDWLKSSFKSEMSQRTTLLFKEFKELEKSHKSCKNYHKWAKKSQRAQRTTLLNIEPGLFSDATT
jgi:hypothetical protein